MQASAGASTVTTGRRVRAASDWLHEEPDFRSVAAQATRLIAIAEALRAIYPHQPLTVLGLDQGTLRLSGRNASEAARIRQIEPRLVAQLRQQGVAVERLKIQSRRTDCALSRPLGGLAQNRSAIPEDALAGLGGLTADLAPGRLSEALTALVMRQRRQRRA
jgi:hypothetical protein